MRALFFTLLLAAACGRHDRKLGQTCTAGDTGTQGDCVDGLFCEVPDLCPCDPGRCAGACRLRCQQDGGACPAGMQCSCCAISPENGGGGVCE